MKAANTVRPEHKYFKARQGQALMYTKGRSVYEFLQSSNQKTNLNFLKTSQPDHLYVVTVVRAENNYHQARQKQALWHTHRAAGAKNFHDLFGVNK